MWAKFPGPTQATRQPQTEADMKNVNDSDAIE